MSRFTQGMLLALLGASLWGFSGGCAQFLLSNYDINAFFVAMLRMPIGGLILLLFVAFRHPGRVTALIKDKSSWLPLALFGIVGLLISQIGYLLSIQYTNAGTATVLQELSTVFVLVWVCLISRRFPHRFEVLALACALTATVLIATGGDPTTLSIPLAGLVFGLINAITVAFYLVQPQKLFQKWGSLLVTGGGMFVGGITAVITWLLLHIPAGSSPEIAALVALPHLDAFGWLVFAILVLIGTCIAYGLYLTGVAIVGSVAGSLVGAAEPVSATLLSTICLGTVFTVTDWVGLALMIVAIVLVAVHPKRAEQPTSEHSKGAAKNAPLARLSHHI